MNLHICKGSVKEFESQADNSTSSSNLAIHHHNLGSLKMDANQSEDVIVFDNLVRPTDVVGEYAELRAVQPAAEPCAQPNAAGYIREVNSLGDIRKCATKSGARLKAMLSE